MTRRVSGSDDGIGDGTDDEADEVRSLGEDVPIASERPWSAWPPSVLRLLRMARWIALGGLALFGVLAVWAIGAILDGEAFDAIVREEFVAPGANGTFTMPERLLAGALLLLGNATGVLAIWNAHRLFGLYERGAVFTPDAAARLRRIGWLIAAIAPLATLADTIGRFVFPALIDPSRTSIEVAISNTDLYALVFGLLLVVVGHVMHEAAALSEENRSFV